MAQTPTTTFDTSVANYPVATTVAIPAITSVPQRRSAPALELIAYSPSPFTAFQAWFKRAGDIAGSLVFCLITSPVWVLTALAIKLDSRGPVFYKQERVGRYGRVFTLYKFRSMVLNAEQATGPVWAIRNDPRVTRVGRLIRKLGIDEFPQIINVLHGEMSLVGPRPERPHFVHQFRRDIPGYSERLRVLPGITGLAQVRHKYDETIDDVRRKLYFDVSYVKTPSLSWDLWIMLYTVFIILTGRGKF